MNDLSGNPIKGNALPLDRPVLLQRRLNDRRRQTILTAVASHELYEAAMHQGLFDRSARQVCLERVAP
jgi:hypothetical protein